MTGKASAQPTALRGALFCGLLTPIAVAIAGYHPYVEDGGLYLAGIKRLLHPGLYPYWSGFVTAHLKLGLFAPLVAGTVRLSHLGLMTVMLVYYLACTWLTLFAGWLLVRQCTASMRRSAGAVTLLALTLSIPVAGTSLMLMDPYVTARSLSTPCGILMLGGALGALTAWTEQNRVAWGSIALCASSFVFAALMHPLMAVYSLSVVLLLACASIPDRRARIATLAALCLLALASAVCMERLGPPNSAAYTAVASTRTYWFLSQWQWYELLGLAGPIAVLFPVWRTSGQRAAGRVALAAIIAALTSILVTLLLCSVAARSYEVARLQPLRVFQTVYLLMLLAIGAFLAERVLKRSLWRWALLLVVAGAGMGFAQHDTFPSSGQIEWPGRAPRNQWEAGFEWVRTHTPENAVFALDANYIRSDGEDSQNFRAIAERSALPDVAKDAGIAAIAPGLTVQWQEGATAQAGLDEGVSIARAAHLRKLGADWIIVPRATAVAFPCSYGNTAVKVCQLPF